MEKTFASILKGVLTTFYQPFWVALIFSILCMFVYKNGRGIKESFRQWIKWFKTEAQFRKVFLWIFCTTMILCITLMNRAMSLNPLGRVLGVWGLHKTYSGTNKTVFTTEAVENFILFIPFIVLLFWCFKDKIFKKVTLISVAWKSIAISFAFSFCIEMLQLLLRVGTWQLSDLAYNTAGGLLGGLIYWMAYRAKHIKKR